MNEFWKKWKIGLASELKFENNEKINIQFFEDLHYKNSAMNCKYGVRENGLAVRTNWIVEANLPREGVDASSNILETKPSLAGAGVK